MSILIRYTPKSLTQQAWDGGLKAALSTAGVEVGEPDKFPVHELWGSRIADA